jgi:hypothetical protein
MATIRFLYRPTGLDNTPPAGGSGEGSAQGATPTELKPIKIDRWWRESSYDLWQGLEVREDAPDTVPAQWLDEFEPRNPG